MAAVYSGWNQIEKLKRQNLKYLEQIEKEVGTFLAVCLQWNGICLQCRRPRFHSLVGKICWRRDRLHTPIFLGFPCGSTGKESACSAGDLGWEDPLEKGKKTTHSSILAWRIPQTYSLWCRRVEHNWAPFVFVFAGGPVARGLGTFTAGIQIQSLVGELRFHRPWGYGQNKKEKPRLCFASTTGWRQNTERVNLGL